MDMLIQNTGSAPIFVSVNKMENGKPVPLPRVIFEPDQQITKISEELYDIMLKNVFYKEKFERGILVPLTGEVQAKGAINESIQAKELNYSKYVTFVSRIKSTGGLSNEQLRPFLDSEGMPSFDLCKKNLGNGFEINTVEEFRTRYLIETANGLHNPILILPTGSSVNAGADNVQIKNEEPKKEEEKPAPKTEKGIEEMSLEELKEKADELKVEYDEDITFKRLTSRVKRAMGE